MIDSFHSTREDTTRWWKEETATPIPSHKLKLPRKPRPTNTHTHRRHTTVFFFFFIDQNVVSIYYTKTREFILNQFENEQKKKKNSPHLNIFLNENTWTFFFPSRRHTLKSHHNVNQTHKFGWGFRHFCDFVLKREKMKGTENEGNESSSPVSCLFFYLLFLFLLHLSVWLWGTW